MTLPTTSATRRTVVSRSSDVANTSATSSSSDSTGNRSGLESTEPIRSYDSSRVPRSSWLAGSAGSKGVSSTQLGATRAALFSRYNANVCQIAVLLRVIQSVAHHKSIGNLEPDIVALQRKLAPRRLVEQRRDLQGSRLVRQQ